MSKAKKIRHDNSAKDQERLYDLGDIQNEIINLEDLEKSLEGNAEIFLLDNFLMTVQLFQNYDREIKLLRENSLREFPLESHHKKCFYAEAMLRLSEANVKFSPRHGANKNSAAQLHPLRVYISSDNVEAAFDPSALGRGKSDLSPQYQFTARTEENFSKSGCISLIEFNTLDRPDKNPSNKPQANKIEFFETLDSKEDPQKNIKSASNEQMKSQLETSTPLQSSNARLLEKRSFLNYFAGPDGVIPGNGFYRIENSEARLKPRAIHDLKMNSAPATSHEIPLQCFQHEEIRNKLNMRRAALIGSLKPRKILNAAAFKGYFCDLLIERLSEPLNLDADALNEGSVQEEFVMVHQKGVRYCIAPVIKIRDWNKFVAVKGFHREQKPRELLWPTRQMHEIIKSLPCSAVPTWHPNPSSENLDHEKTWKLVFPEAEEFLLLHMMHAHIRCYFFVLLIYKSFLESEINSASLGPKHLTHLLFWKVHNNFLAWPDDRPAETLLNYLKALYKKLQNKSLPDFFIPSRNLLAGSLPKDLHKAQALIKKIIENPVPYVIRAISQLTFKESFYPTFDHVKFYNLLTRGNVTEIPKKAARKEKKTKKVRFYGDEEQIWTKNIIQQIEQERKAETQEQTGKISVNSINLNDILNFNSSDYPRFNQILQMLTSHFLQMGTASIRFQFLSQGLFYLTQAQKLHQLMATRGMNQADLRETSEGIGRLKQNCFIQIKQELAKPHAMPKIQFPTAVEKSDPGSERLFEKHGEEGTRKEQVAEETSENEVISIKL